MLVIETGVSFKASVPLATLYWVTPTASVACRFRVTAVPVVNAVPLLIFKDPTGAVLSRMIL